MTKRINHTDKGRVRRHHYSLKMKDHFVLDSIGERDIALTMEFQNDIQGYKAQPFSTLYKGLDGKQHRYTPDFLVESTSSQLAFIEVKPAKFATSLKFESEFLHLQAHFEKRYNLPLRLMTDKSYTSQRFKNCRQLYRYRLKPITEDDKRLVNYVGRNLINFAELKEAALRIQSPIYSPFKLVAQGVCEMDMDNEILNDATVLEISL